MVNNVRARPEYNEVREILLEIVREKAVDVDRINRLFRELYWQGNVFNDWNCNRIPLCFVLTYIKFHDTE